MVRDSPSPKATRVISPVNGCLSESTILRKQGWGFGDKSGLWVKTAVPLGLTEQLQWRPQSPYSKGKPWDQRKWGSKDTLHGVFGNLGLLGGSSRTGSSQSWVPLFPSLRSFLSPQK